MTSLDAIVEAFESPHLSNRSKLKIGFAIESAVMKYHRYLIDNPSFIDFQANLIAMANHLDELEPKVEPESRTKKDEIIVL